MTQTTPFVRKAVYLALVGALLIPVSLLSRPASRAQSGEVADAGGIVSQMRQDYRLSQSQLSDIDPTSETMKLATLGLRGVAVNLLWAQANEQKKKEEWDGFEATLNALIKIQPNFVKVWEFQAHNLSYNISAEFDDFEYRYAWVRKGILFLAGGIPYNLREHKILDGLGDFLGMKIGNADEKAQFRRMFREDADLHSELARYIDPQLYYHPSFGHDHWRMAYWWYDRSEKLVESGESVKRTNDLVYYMKRPSQIRHQAIALQDEFRTNDAISEIWREAADEWRVYGNRTIVTSRGSEITLNGLAPKFTELARLRRQLDQLAPGIRDERMAQVYLAMNMPEEDIRLAKLPLDQVPDDQMGRFRAMMAAINDQMGEIDLLVYEQVPAEKQVEARQLLDEINGIRSTLALTDQYQGTSNYLYWIDRCAEECDPEGVRARQAWFDADELRRKSVFDDEMSVDPATGEKRVARQGAISALNTVFRLYKELLHRFPTLETGDITESLIDTAKDYNKMLSVAGQEWPDDFPLQKLVDRRMAIGDHDGLPVSEGVVSPAERPPTGRNIDNLLLRPERSMVPGRPPAPTILQLPDR